MSTSIWDIYKRFHTEVYEDNTQILHDVKAVQMVSELTRERVDYERPHLNFPINGHQSTLYGLQEQGSQVLKKAGFSLEARHFNFLMYACGKDMDYKTIVDTMFYFLDFSNDKLNKKQRQLLKQLERIESGEVLNQSLVHGSDSSEEPLKLELEDDEDPSVQLKLRVSFKNKLKNSLPVLSDANSTSKQWAFLRQNADKTNAFGKNALFCLSESMYDHMVSHFLRQMFATQKQKITQSTEPKALVDEEMGVSKDLTIEPMSIQEFEQMYPLGFIDLDYLHSSVMVQTGLSVESKMGLALWELIHRGDSGMPLDQVRRLGWDHKDQVGITGSAVWAEQMSGVFLELANEKKASKSNFKQCEWMNVLQEQFNELRDLTPVQMIWLVYAYADPKNCMQVRQILETMVKEQAKDKIYGSASAEEKISVNKLKEVCAQAERLTLMAQNVPWERMQKIASEPKTKPEDWSKLESKLHSKRL